MIAPKTSAPPAASALSIISSAVTRIFRLQVDEFLARGIVVGSLTLTYPHDTPAIFGETVAAAKAASHPVATLHVANPPSFYARVATQADIGFAEAYIAEDVTVAHPSDLVSFFRVLILNRDADADGSRLSTTRLLVSRLGTLFNVALHALNRNTVHGARRNIRAHYDLSNDLFATFLGPTWTYSCAQFGPNARTLDDAQIAKIDTVLTKARVRADGTMRLLDIGCGWGELAIRAVKHHGVGHVTGITLSEEQLALARRRADAAGVGDRVTFELVDYRDLARRGERRFDRVTSVEMIEAVGHGFLGEYFSSIERLLAPDDGVAVIQAITTPEGRYDAYRNSTDFIQKHIFPGGICPSLEAMVNAIGTAEPTGAGGKLIVENIENIGVNYATTLAEWRRKFLLSVKEGKVEEAGFDEAFVRKWVYYFCYCESGFATRTLGVLQLVLTRVNNVSAFGGPPTAAAS